MPDRPSPKPSVPEPAAMLRAALVVAAVAALALLVWQLAEVLLLGFAAVLFAVVLRSVAWPIERYTPLSRTWSLLPAGVVVAAIVAGFAYFLGARIVTQVTELIERLPELLAVLGDRLGIENLQARLDRQVENLSLSTGWIGRVAGYTSWLVATIANAVLVAAAGVYLAARPDRYRKGVLLLVPPRVRNRAGSAFDNAGRALRLWLLGQLVSMAVVGLLVMAGLYAIGLPSALALGFLAGVAEFVPLIGAVLGAVPAVLLALSEGGPTVYWVVGLFVAVQLIEGNVVMPLVQRRAVDLPPVVTLFAILALGVLFGPLGVFLGAPLAVVLYIAVLQLYIRDTLEEDVQVPGDDS